MRPLLPTSVCNRPKRPYRAPIQRSFFGDSAPAYVREMLSPEAIRAFGYFNPGAVSRLTKKALAARPLSEREGIALAGTLSTPLLHHQFVETFMD